MDFATITDNVNVILKTAGVEGGTTDAYKDIPSVDAQREIIVSHMKSDYSDKTLKALNAKAFADTANTYRNMTTSTEGDIEKLRSNASDLETKVNTREKDLKASSQRTLILQVLAGTIALVVAVYYMFGSSEYVHSLALACLVVGFGYAMYLRGSGDTKTIVNYLDEPIKAPTLSELSKFFNIMTTSSGTE